MAGLTQAQISNALVTLTSFTRELAETVSDEMEQSRGVADPQRRETKQKIRSLAGKLERLEIDLAELRDSSS